MMLILDIISDWKIKIESLIVAGNIVNCDETGLLVQALPNKTLKLKGKKCSG